MSSTLIKAPARRFKLQLTIVFQKINEAVEAKDENGERRYKYIILKGSSRSSKTMSLIDFHDFYARKHKNKRATIWRDTKKDVVDTVFNDLKKRMVDTDRWKFQHGFHATTHVLSYNTGSTIEFRGADEITAHGLNQNTAWLNEPYIISRTTFDQIDQRTEDFIFIDWNPKQGHWIEDVAKDPRAIVIHSTFLDNPFCPLEQKYKILSYQPVSMCSLVINKKLKEQEARDYDYLINPAGFDSREIKELTRCRENEFKKSANLFNWQVYGLGIKGERPNRIFRFIEIPDSRFFELRDVPELFYSDWGAVDPWAVGHAKYYDGAIYLHELNYRSENEIRQFLTDTERHQIGVEENGLVGWTFSRLNIPYESTIVCDPNRHAKIIAARQAGWEYAVAADKPPGSIIDGIDLLCGLTVYFTASSKNIAYEQENYSRKVDPHGVVLEEPEDINNHHMDGSRYAGLKWLYEGVIQPRK